MIADDDPRIRHDFGYKGERAEMERFIAPYPELVALSAKIRQKTIAAWAAGDGETPDEDAWESGDPDNPGVVELVFGFQEQYATLTGALVDGFSEGAEYDYDAYFLSQGVCPGCWEGCIGEGGPICACEQRGALAAREWRMSQRNIQASPPLEVQTGRLRYVPQHRILPPEEAHAVWMSFERAHPIEARLADTVLGWTYDHMPVGRRELAQAIRLVAFRPVLTLLPVWWNWLVKAVVRQVA
jgi:hypothetical protein